MNDKEILSTDEKSIVEKIIANRKMHENTVLLFDESHLVANAFCRIATMKADNARLTKQLENSVQLPKPYIMVTRNGKYEVWQSRIDTFCSVTEDTFDTLPEAEARLAELEGEKK